MSIFGYDVQYISWSLVPEEVIEWLLHICRYYCIIRHSFEDYYFLDTTEQRSSIDPPTSCARQWTASCKG